MPQSSDLMYIALVVIYIAAVSWYIVSTLINRKSKDSESKPESRSSSGKPVRSRRGKRCTNCKQIIDARRTLCQHCGQEFRIDPNSEPHPDEIRTGRRKPLASTPPTDATPASP